MLLTYKNLTIRNAALGDAPVLCQWWNDGQVMAHAGFPNGLNTSQASVERQIAATSEDTFSILIIEVDGCPVGEMSCCNQRDGIAEIGIKICKTSKQGKGHGPLFLQMLITHLFGNGYEKIILDTNLANTRAQHVYEKLGFQKLRVNHNAWHDQLGQPQSSVDYELVKHQFLPLP